VRIGGVEPGRIFSPVARRGLWRVVGAVARRREPVGAGNARADSQEGDDGSKFIAAAEGQEQRQKLMGFGHRVY